MDAEAGAEREAFAQRLRQTEGDEPTVEAYLRIAERIVTVAGSWSVLPKHVDEALRRAEQDGAQPHQLANLKRVGDALVAFRRASVAPPSAVLSMGTAPSARGACPACGATFTLLPAPASSAGAMQSVGGLVGAGLGFVIVRLLGCFGAFALAMAFGACVSLYRGLTLKARCERCGRVAAEGELDAPTEGTLSAAKRKQLWTAAGLSVAAALFFVVWIAAAVVLTPQ